MSAGILRGHAGAIFPSFRRDPAVGWRGAVAPQESLARIKVFPIRIFIRD